MKIWIPVLILAFMSCSSVIDNVSPEGNTTGEVTDAFRDEMLAGVNQLRASGCQCGSKWMPKVPPLKWSAKLEKSAKAHAIDMYSKGFLSHDGSNGSDFSERISNTGYDWSAVGENVAWGYDSIEDAIGGWVESPDHCKAMMSSSYTEIGAANAGSYWVQDFGRPW